MNKCYLCRKENVSLYPIDKNTYLCKECQQKKGINIFLGMLINAKCSICGKTSINIKFVDRVHPVCMDCITKSGVNKKDKSITLDEVRNYITEKNRSEFFQTCMENDIKDMVRKKNPIAIVQKAELKHLAETLQNGEKILTAIQGEINKKFGIVLLTNQRILFASGIQSCMETKSIYITDITETNQKGISVLGDKLQIKGKNIDFILDSEKTSIIEFQDLLSQQIYNSKNIATNITAPLSSADEILKFKKLLDNGIITEDEFNAKKKQLLGL